MNLVNLTPHAIALQRPDGARITISPSGAVARVSATSGPAIEQPAELDVPVPVHAAPSFGPVEGLPAPCARCRGVGVVAAFDRSDREMAATAERTQAALAKLGLSHLTATPLGHVVQCRCPECGGRAYLVSALVIGRPEVAGRNDVVAPGTGPDDAPVRAADGPRKGQVEAVTRLIAAPRCVGGA